MTTKTERTRARIMESAFALFAKHGYDGASVAQIADAAGVSEMTFFRHFPTKDRLLIGDPYDPLIAEAVAAQPRDLDLLTRAARGIRSAWHAVPFPETGEVRQRVRFVAETPSLRAALARGTADTEHAVAAALGGGPSARIAAAAVLAALNTALLDWAVEGEGQLGAAIDGALDVLERSHG